MSEKQGRSAGTRPSPNAAGRAGRGENLTTDELDTDELVTTEEAAKVKGVDRALISRARDEGLLRPVKRGERGVFLYRRADVIAVDVKRLSPSNDREKTEGSRDARVFTGFREGLTVAEIVEREQVPVRVALQLKEQWVAAHRADALGIDHRCRACHTEPANPSVSYCTRCASRVHVLRQDQVDAVLGMPPTENSCSCAGCGRSVRVEQADHVCSSCRGRVFVGVSEGRLHVKIRSASGEDLTLRTLSIEETAQIAAQLTPAVQAASSVSPIVPLPPREEHGSVAERIDSMRKEIAKEMGIDE